MYNYKYSRLTSYNITEDETGYKLTDIFEIHYLELAKLENKNIDKDENLAIRHMKENNKSKMPCIFCVRQGSDISS